MEELKVGDIVCLKSGGPDMTVSTVFENGTVDVMWYHEDGRLIRDHFVPIDALNNLPRP